MANATAFIELLLKDKRFQAAMKTVGRVMEKMRGKMLAVSQSAKRMLIVGGGAITGLLKIAADQQASERALDVALEATGHSTEIWSSRMRDAASAIQDVTTYGDEANLMLMAQMLNLGVSADKLEEATRGAIGLATALGQDVRSGARNMAMAMSGNYLMLRRYIPALRATTDEAEQLHIVTDFAARGFKQAENNTKTFTGRLKQLWNSYGDLNEVLGDVFLPDVERFIAKLKAMVPIAARWVKGNKDLILTITKLSAGVLITLTVLPKLAVMVTGLVSLITGLKVAFLALNLSMSAGVAIWGGAIAIATGLAAAIAIVQTKVFSLNRALKQSTQDSKEFAAAWEHLQKVQKHRAETNTLDTGIHALESQIAARKKVIATFQSDMDKYGKEPRTFDVFLRLYHEDAQQTLLSQAQRNRDKMVGLLEQDEKLLAKQLELKRQRDAAAPTAKQLETTDAIAALTEQVRLQGATYGMTSNEVKLYKLAQEDLTSTQLDALIAASNLMDIEEKRLAAISKTEVVTKTAEDRIKTLNREIAALAGISKGKLELLDLQNLGVGEDKLREIMSLMGQRDALTKEEKLIAKSPLGARFEALQATFKRIQSAAATPELIAAQSTAKSSAKTNTLLGKLNTQIKRMVDSLQAQPATVGVYGP